MLLLMSEVVRSYSTFMMLSDISAYIPGVFYRQMFRWISPVFSDWYGREKSHTLTMF